MVQYSTGAAVDAWGGWFMFALFAGILIWEEVWDLPNSAALSGWLLILITAGAVICSAIFERRLWCKHLCPIGAMNGLFAKGSITELRATQGVCTSETANAWKDILPRKTFGHETFASSR